jgi:amino acid adenylation domain-containing protein
VLLLVIHHITFDGWSARVFVEELAALYDAFVAGKPSPFPELPIQYADFAHWQRQWLQGEVLERQLSYWKEKLAGSLPSLDLPTDRPRPAVQTHCGARQSSVLSSFPLQALKALSRQEGVTLFMTLLAAFKVLLYRYTGQDDIAVGSPIAGRTHVETEGLIGFFVNTLVLRTDLSGNPTFRELLGRVREVALGAYAHQDLPFEKLVEALQPERDLSRTPLFQVMFNLENIPTKAVKTPSLSIDEFEFDSGVSQFDLALEVIEKDEGLSCLLNYSTDLFDAATIERMLGHYQTLLEGIVADPEERIGVLPLLTEAERHQLLVEWNDTQADYPKDSCIHQLFEAQVERTPDAVALAFKDQQLTYHELNTRANQLAHYLRKRGVEPGVLVSICVERSLEMVVGILGILKAGGAYVPLDPAYPQERLAFMLEDAQVSVLLTQRRLLEKLSEHRARVVCLDTSWEAIAGESEENPASEVTTNNLAYMIYTSGSTGKPKGVQIQHRAVVNFLNSMHEQLALTNQDVLLSVTTLSFDIAVLELFLPLSVGACITLVSRQVAADGVQLLARLTSSGATVMQATPVTWRLLLEARWQGSQPLKILCGGEALPRELAHQLLRWGVPLWNLYGPTETTVWATAYKVEPEGSSVPIGRPIANTQIYLLDAHLQPVPIGVPGELHIGGIGLARGYLNRPEMTAEKFIPNPFSDEPGTRLYKTGDLARYLPDGNIEFLGRIDHQVKVRGFRIELGEIETVLGRHPTVRETVVMARKDVLGDNRLVAYVVPNQKPAPTTNELRSFLKRKLPQYMVPSTFMFLDALPLTPNGKVDRRALPAPDRVRPELERAFVAPRTPIEEMLAGIWAEVLGLEEVGIHDNFFELGGHSLVATQVMYRVRAASRVELSLRSLFERPTVAGLAEYVDRIPLIIQKLQAPTSIAAGDREEIEL